jgi:hypothetical protein
VDIKKLTLTTRLKNKTGSCEFCENWHSESHKILGGVNKFPSVLPTFTVSFG